MTAHPDFGAAPRKPSPLSPGLCILLVEDDEADAYLIHRALWEHPAVGNVVHVRDGVEALATVQGGGLEPDMAFIDLQMPRLDGFALLTALTNGADVAFPMVVLTSSSAPSDAIGSRLRNALRVIIKPETAAELSAALKASIDAVWRGGEASLRNDPVRIQTQTATRAGARNAAFLRLAARLARVGGWEIDFVTRQASFSPELCELLASPRTEMSINEVTDLWVVEDRAAFCDALAAAADHGTSLAFEGRTLSPDGVVRQWRLLGEPMLVDTYCVALRGVAQDVTGLAGPTTPPG